MRTRAFTLLELLLALGLVVIITGAMATTLYTAFRAKTRAEATVGATRAQDLAVAMVSQDLASALPGPIDVTGTGTTDTSSASGSGTTSDTTTTTLVGSATSGSAFVGSTSDVTFYCAGSDGQANMPGGIAAVTYSFEQLDGAQDSSLVRRVNANLLAATQTDAVPEVICPHVESLTWRYSDGTTWYDTWDSADHSGALPTAVEMVMAIAPREEGQPSVQVDQVLRVPCGVTQTELDAQAQEATDASGGAQ